MNSSTETLPHSSWADLYDEIYEETFGSFYSDLRSETLRLISSLVGSGASIVDFGAGTGRLSVPLAAAGHHVTAVEPSGPMLAVLSHKAAAAGLPIRAVESRMADFVGDGSAHLATSVFTVIAYVLTEDELLRTFRAAAAALQPGGLLLLDVPRREIFSSVFRTTARVQRRVTITPETDEIFLYEEETRVERDGCSLEARDRFRIRCWTPALVRQVLEDTGFTLDRDLSDDFGFTGAHYWCCRKR